MAVPARTSFISAVTMADDWLEKMGVAQTQVVVVVAVVMAVVEVQDHQKRNPRPLLRNNANLLLKLVDLVLHNSISNRTTIHLQAQAPAL